MSSCIFCDIVNGQSPDTVIEFENDEIVIFNDIHPASKVHLLAVPKVHIESAKCFTKEHEGLINEMENCLKEVLQSKNLDTNDAVFGFHWPSLCSVWHVHMHGIAPASEIGTFLKFKYIPGSYWFKTPEKVRKTLQ